MTRLIDRIENRPPATPEEFIAQADAPPAVPAVLAAPASAEPAVEAPTSTVRPIGPRAPRLSESSPLAQLDPYGSPSKGFNLRLNEFELELLRRVTEARGEELVNARVSMQTAARAALREVLERMARSYDLIA